MSPWANLDAMSCRLFIALWPDDAARDALLGLQAELIGGRPVPAANLHLTLAFLGQQPANMVPLLRGLSQRWSNFDCLLRFDQLGYFRRPRIAWVGMRDIPEPLIALHGSVQAALAEAGVSQPGAHDGFVPHVSLLRDAEPLSQRDIAPIMWRARSVVLAESIVQPGGSQYRILSRDG
jgi:2'-5' RNA ligase